MEVTEEMLREVAKMEEHNRSLQTPEDQAAIIIADLFAMVHGAPANCGVLADPLGEAMHWFTKWREDGRDFAANSFTGRWLLEGPPPWPDDLHIPRRD